MGRFVIGDVKGQGRVVMGRFVILDVTCSDGTFGGQQFCNGLWDALSGSVCNYVV